MQSAAGGQTSGLGTRLSGWIFCIGGDFQKRRNPTHSTRSDNSDFSSRYGKKPGGLHPCGRGKFDRRHCSRRRSPWRWNYRWVVYVPHPPRIRFDLQLQRAKRRRSTSGFYPSKRRCDLRGRVEGNQSFPEQRSRRICNSRCLRRRRNGSTLRRSRRLTSAHSVKGRLAPRCLPHPPFIARSPRKRLGSQRAPARRFSRDRHAADSGLTQREGSVLLVCHYRHLLSPCLPFPAEALFASPDFSHRPHWSLPLCSAALRRFTRPILD